MAQSWVKYSKDSDFSIQNLPYGVFRPAEEKDGRIGTRIGDNVVCLSCLSEAGFFDKIPNAKEALCESTLNTYMSLGRKTWVAVRAVLTNLLTDSQFEKEVRKAFHEADKVVMLMPAKIGDYTDFYSSRIHATNVGTIFRGKENALQPNWTWLPVGYHGRASTVVISGTDLKRPNGQLCPGKMKDGKEPTFGPCKALDYEVEMAFFVGPPNKMGSRIKIDDARDHIFGAVLMNDWSARDIQGWEYVPLGPFNGKNLGTTISAWIVTMEALKPFRTHKFKQEPKALDYLSGESHKNPSTFDINLTVAIQGEKMDSPSIVGRTNLKNLYWTFEQQLTHHTSTGCQMNSGDLCGTGTISGTEKGEFGSLLENKIFKGEYFPKLSDGSERRFLKDNDTVVMKGHCQGDGYRVGFGECVGKVLPADKE